MGKMHQGVTGSCTKIAKHTQVRKPKKRCTANQIVSLIKYMSMHPRLAKNKYSPHEILLNKKDEEWTRLAAQLNKMNKRGTKKTVTQWKITWRDLVRQSKRKAEAMKNKARAAVDVPDSMKSSDEDDDEVNDVSVWKMKIANIMKSTNEDSGEEEIHTVSRPSETISVPATPEEVGEPKSPASQLISSELSESESDSCTTPTPSDRDPVKKRCTIHQMISLIEYMSRHPRLAKNLYAPHEARLKKKEWTLLAAHLNKMGSEKTVAQWINTWRNLVRITKRKAKAMKNKARAAENVPDSMKSSDEDDDEVNEVSVWKKKIVDIMKSSDEESGEEEIQTVSKQPSESISVPASPTPEEVEEPKSPASELNSPEPSESESDSPCTSPSPTPSDHGPAINQLNSPDLSESESDSPCTSATPSDHGPAIKRTKRSKMAQLQTLVDCMALNPSMGFGPQDSNTADWQRLAELLKTMGPSKKVVEWQKTWHYMKSKAVLAAKKKSRMKDGVPLSLMRQKITEIIAAYTENTEIIAPSKDQSNELDESRVKFDELPCPTEGMPVLFARSLSPPSRLNSPDLDNIGLDISINSQDIGLNPEMSTLSLDEDTSRLGIASPSPDSGQMSPFRYDSDQSSDQTSSKPKAKRKIVSHACTRVQKAALVDYMNTHTALAISTYKGEDTLDPNRYAEWRHLTEYLNKMGPAKTTQFWKRTWKELFVRSKQAEQTSGSKGIFQKISNFTSETPKSQDNLAKTDTDSAGKKSPERRNSDQMSPERRNPDQMSPERRNPDQVSPERRDPDQISPERPNCDQVSPERPYSGQRPVQRIEVPVRCYASQVSSQGSEQISTMPNSTEFLEIVEGRASPTESDAELEMLAMLKGPEKNRCTMSQTKFLVGFMKENVDFAINKPYTRAVRKKWRRLSENLNKMGPPKSVQSWRTTWRDLKRNALSRKRDNALSLLPHHKAILEIIEAHKSQATITEETASMSGEDGQTDSSKQSRKTIELVENTRCSEAQIAALADYMTANPVLATSEYKGPCADDPTIECWRQLGKYLNRMGVARSTTGWKQIWRNIVTCVRKSQQPMYWDEKIYSKILKAVGGETIVKNHSELTIEIVEESGQMSSVHNFNQMSPPHNTDRESPVNFDQMSPLHSTGHVPPVDFDQMSLVNIDQISPMHNTGQVSLQYLDITGQAPDNFGQTSSVHNNHQSPVNTGQMSPVKSSGHNNCQVNSGQGGDLETSAVEMENDIEVDPPLYSKRKRMKIIRTNRAQVKAIVNYMSTHPALAKGEEKGPIAVQKRKLEWRRLGKHLNRMGPTKSTDAWKHTWRDLRRSARTAKNSTGFHAQIYQQILNIMSPAYDGPIESSINTVVENDTLPTPRPTEDISFPLARSPSPELCLNAPDPLQCDDEPSSDVTRHKNSGKHSQQIPSVGQSNNVSTRHKDSEKLSQQKSSLGQSNNLSTRLQDSGKHGLQITSLSEFRNILRNFVHSNQVFTRKEKDSQTNKEMSLPLSRHKESSHQISPVPRTSGESNNVSTRFKESEEDSLQMSSAQRSSGQSNNKRLFRHIESNDWDGARERRVERSTQTRKQLNSLVDCVYDHPALASEHETSNPRHHEWRAIGKLLNKMGPIYSTDWKNRWKELKNDVARSWKKDGTYTGCIDSVRVKKVLELIAKYPTADLTDSDIEMLEDMSTQAPTTHHPTSSVQHKAVEILSRNHTVDRDSINAGSIEKIATLNVENRTAGRDSIERGKQEGDKASSATAASNISSEDTNSLLKELIGELRRSNELKVEQNGILKQLVNQFSTEALKTNSKKKEPQIKHVEPRVVLKREIEDLTGECSINMRNSERSEEHYAHASIQDGPSHKDVHITSVKNSAKSSKRPQIPTSSKEEATSSPKDQIRLADITRLMKPSEPINRVVKVKTITKVPQMPKVNLIRLKDGTMMVMPGTKLPASTNEYQTFVVGSVKHVDNQKVAENENPPAGFEEYEY